MVKVCGIKNIETALYAAECGADALGFVFAPSRRRVTPDEAREIVRRLPRSIWKVGVFVDEDPEVVSETASYCGLDTLQFHGSESPEYCRRFSLRVLKALRVRGDRFFPDPDRYSTFAYVLDTYVEGMAGGTGRSFKWGLARRVDSGRRVIIAGGLSPENVARALEEANPYGVDVSSGVETDGEKDCEKIRLFIEEVRRWENAGAAR